MRSKKELLVHAAVIREDLGEGIQLNLGRTGWADTRGQQKAWWMGNGLL